jgi:hypothetical protein
VLDRGVAGEGLAEQPGVLVDQEIGAVVEGEAVVEVPPEDVFAEVGEGLTPAGVDVVDGEANPARGLLPASAGP